MSIDIASWMTRFRWSLLFIGLAFTLLSSIGLTNLKVLSDVRMILDEDNPGLMAVDLTEEYFQIPRSFTVFIHEHRSQLNTETLVLIDKLSQDFQLAPYVTSVRSLANSTITYSEQDTLLTEYIYERDVPRQNLDEWYRKISALLIKDPTLLHSFISKTSQMSAIVVNTSHDQNALGDNIKETHTALLDYVEAFTLANPQYRIDLSGELAFDLIEEETFNHDLTLNIGMSLLVIFIVLLAIFRSISTASVVYLVSIFSCVSALGFAGFLGIRINNINLIAPIIIIVIAILDGIHFITSYQNARVDKNKTDAIRLAIKLTYKPVTLTTITTVTGFLTLNISSSPAVASLGNIAAFGILMAWVLTYSLLPSLAGTTTLKKIDRGNDWINTLLSTLQCFVFKYARYIVAGFSIALLFFTLNVPRLTIDDNPLDSLDDSLPFVKSLEFIQEQMHSASFNLLFDTGREGGVHTAGFLNDVDELVHWLKQQPNVVNAYSYADQVKRINEIMHNDDAAFYIVPDNDNLVSQYALINRFSVPSPDELTRYLDLEERRLLVTVLVDEMSRSKFNQLVEQINYQAAQIGLSEKMKVSGWLVVFNSEIMTWINQLVKGFLVALLIISLQMLIYFRSIKFGLICLVPNLLPIGITFGLWSYVGETFSFTALLVLSASFGIVIDDTIHFMSKFSEYFKKHQRTREAITHAFNYSGRAIVVTTFALAIGVSPMFWSNYYPLQSISMLLIPIAVLALLIDLILLPAILLLAYKSKTE